MNRLQQKVFAVVVFYFTVRFVIWEGRNIRRHERDSYVRT